MKTLNIAVTSLLLFAGEAFAVSTVSDVVARQRWPWNGKVDIDYTLTGDKTDVDFYATWDGQTTPVFLGTDYSAEAGQHRYELDPSAFGLSDKVTTGFTVTASAVSADDHKYLVVDLVNGGYSYLAGIPAGNDGKWTDEYKTRKMVFRRIPLAGQTCTLGISKEELDKWYSPSTGNPYKDEQRGRGARQQSFGSDFYMAIFQMSEAQYDAVTKGSVGTKLTPKTLPYNELRGSTNETDGINWPSTKYRVAVDSVVQKLRNLTGGRLLVDLPTEEQWEAAARAGTTTVFPVGGTVDMTDDELLSILDPVAWYFNNGGTEAKAVGLKNPANSLGLFDLVGNRTEWTLDVYWVDVYGRVVAPTAGKDVVGRATWQNNPSTGSASYKTRVNAAFGMRVARSSYPNYSNVVIQQQMLPSVRTYADPASQYACSARLCIHLKSLDFTTAN